MPTGEGGERKAGPAAPIRRADLWLAAVLLAGAAVLYGLTAGFDRAPELLAQNIQAAWFPRLLIWTIAALALALPFERRFSHRAGPAAGPVAGGAAGGETPRPIRRAALATAALLLLIVAAIPVLGALAAMVLACVALPLLWGERRLWLLAAFAVLFPAAVALVFGRLLNAYLEPGLLGLVLP